MTNTHATPWPSTHHGEPLPAPDEGSGPFELIGWQIADQRTSNDVEIRIEIEVAGLRHDVRGHGSDRVAAFADAVRHAGVRVGVPHREVHDWDGASGTVTSYVRCLIDGVDVAGAGIARERGEATMRAMIAAAHAAMATRGALLHT